MSPRLIVAVLLGTFIAAPAAQPLPSVEADEPRAFGYQVGDIVRRSVTLHVPEGWQLERDSLPRPGGRGQPIELRRVESREQHEPGGTRHELKLEYQVFFAPTAVRSFELPPWAAMLRGAARNAELRVEAWPVTVAPLVPVEVSPRRGLGELQPDRAPPMIDVDTTQRRLVLWLGAAALFAALLAAQHLGLPWLARRQRPFERAWRDLRRLDAAPDDAQWRAACRRLHEALDASAGAVLFEHGLDDFVAARPAFAPLREQLGRFLQQSRREFFADAPREPGAAAALVALCRRCRDAERDS